MGKGDDGDLRKEVEMNEHQISTEELARQYDLNLSTGLSEAEVKKVNFNLSTSNFKFSTLFLAYFFRDDKLDEFFQFISINPCG